MPPHSSTTAAAGSRPWISSQTSEPITPSLGMLVHPRLRGAHHAGGAGELAGHDATGLDRRLEGPAHDLAAERDEEVIAGLGHPAADDHHLGVHDVEHVGDADAEVAGGVAHQLV